MVRTQGRLRTGLIQSLNQLAIAVVATVAATALYPALRHGYDAMTATAPTPAAPAAGKFAARIAGAEPAPPAALPRPTLSIVNWGVTPTRSPLLIDDVAWASHAFEPAEAPATPPLRAAREPRRSLARIEPAAPLPLPRLSVVQATAPAETKPDGLWARTEGLVVGTAQGAIRTVGWMGSTVLARVLP